MGEDDGGRDIRDETCKTVVRQQAIIISRLNYLYLAMHYNHYIILLYLSDKLSAITVELY